MSGSSKYRREKGAARRKDVQRHREPAGAAVAVAGRLVTAPGPGYCPGCLHPWWAHPSQRYGRVPPECIGQDCRCTREVS